MYLGKWFRFQPLVFRFQPQIPILQAFLRCAYDLVPVIPGTGGTGDKNPTGWLVWQPSYILRIYTGSHIKGERVPVAIGSEGFC